jgi:hypothetical protein
MSFDSLLGYPHTPGDHRFPVRCDKCGTRFDLHAHPDACPGCKGTITAVHGGPNHRRPAKWRRPTKERPARFILAGDVGKKSPRQIKKILTRPRQVPGFRGPSVREIIGQPAGIGAPPTQVRLTRAQRRELLNPVHHDGHALLGRELIPYMAALRHSDWERERDLALQVHGMAAEARRIRVDEEISKAIRWHLVMQKRMEQINDRRGLLSYWQALQLWDDALGPIPPASDW